MSKAFGRIVLASTIIAGAAVGGYAYLKKEGKLPASLADAPSDTNAEEVAEAEAEATFASKARNYVDLASTKLEKPMAEAKEAVSGAKDIAAEAMGVVKETVADVAKELKVVVSDASSKISDVVKEAKEEAAKTADKASEDVADEAALVAEEATEAVEEAVEAVEAVEEATEEKAEEFTEGLQTEKVDADDHIIGADSEEFFNDEEQ